jgi:hypothetical protein
VRSAPAPPPALKHGPDLRGTGQLRRVECSRAGRRSPPGDHLAARPRLVWLLLACLTALWTNLHGSFILVLFLLLASALGSLCVGGLGGVKMHAYLARFKRAHLPAADLTDAFVSGILGEHDRQREAYRRVLALSPDNPQALAYFAANPR